MTAPAETGGARRLEWHTLKLIENPVTRYGLMAGVLIYLFWALGSLDVDWNRISQGVVRTGNMFGRMFPPDFSRSELLIREVVVSVQMALAASFFGMILAVPIGLCAAVNLVPRPVYLVARAIIVLSRTFHEIIWAIFFVKIVGFGPLAGVLTLTIASVSFISKMLAEDVENMPPEQLEAVRATGASFPKLLIYCISPQALPRYLGVSIYRLDANIRHSTVVGIVGAGGIGILLYSTMNLLRWEQVSVLLVSIFAVVVVSEFVSAAVRQRIT